MTLCAEIQEILNFKIHEIFQKFLNLTQLSVFLIQF